MAKSPAQLEREIAKVLAKPRAMTLKRADEIIRAAKLAGFSGRCGRVAIAINRVVFDNKGRGGRYMQGLANEDGWSDV